MVNYKALSIVFVVITIILAALTGYLVAYPSSSTHTTTATTTVTSTASPSATSSTPLAVNLVYKAGIGFYLTNASGYTLYFRTTDPGNGSSTCTGSCVNVWPLFYAGAGTFRLPSSLNSSSFGVAARSDGLKQTTFNGYPLYYYVGDKAPGQITGQGKGNFYACCSVVAATTTTSSSSTSSSAAAAVSKVTIPSGAYDNQSSQGNLGFYPNTITVVIGINNTVMWTNNDIATHTVTSSSVPAGAQSFDDESLNPGSTFSVTLTIAGTYQYHCNIHPWMHGTIIVKS
jgi:plastocyanin/predicted lipoprotein with Yx(FWY)xxD motif